jgi:CHAD domain-containing protein
MPELDGFALSFTVPAGQRPRVLAELRRGATQTVRMTVHHIDTPDDRLAASGFAWQLRRESRVWIQALTLPRHDGPGHAEQVVACPDARADATLHAGTEPGERLVRLLRRAADEGHAPQVRVVEEVLRHTRRVRTRDGAVTLTLDEGRLMAGEARATVLELALKGVPGSAGAVLALARRWQRRFGLRLQPCTRSERGLALARGARHLCARKALPPVVPRDASARRICGAVLQECMDQIVRNAVALAEGGGPEQAEQVHQLRVGLRRLRSAMRILRGWLAPPPSDAVDGFRRLFTALGQARERGVLEDLMDELAHAGAPLLTSAPAAREHDPGTPDPGALMRSTDAQALLLTWIAWTDTAAGPCEAVDTTSLRQAIRRRLRRWRRDIAEQARKLDAQDEPALHLLRKRIKRLRYAIELMQPLLGKRKATDQLRLLAQAQELLGHTNDLITVRDRLRGPGRTEPATWFALGWLGARIPASLADAKPVLLRLARWSKRRGSSPRIRTAGTSAEVAPARRHAAEPP